MHYIDFPNLGIHLEMNPTLFTVGPFTVHWYGIITALAFLVIILGVLRDSPEYGLKRDDLIDLMLILTPLGILGARIFYVLVNWDYYANNLSEIYKIWHGGLAIYGGIILGLITIYLFCRKREINPLQLLDHLVVYLVLGQVIGRWGNFVNQELFGPNTNLPWAMTGDIIKSTIIQEQFPGVDPSLPVHPLFLYESLWNLVAFFVLLWFRRKKKLEGEVFSLYMIFYGAARFTIDSLRFDLRVGEGNINVNRVIGLLFILAFLTVFIVRRIRLKNKAVEEIPYEPSQYREVLEKIEEAGETEPSVTPVTDDEPNQQAEQAGDDEATGAEAVKEEEPGNAHGTEAEQNKELDTDIKE